MLKNIFDKRKRSPFIWFYLKMSIMLIFLGYVFVLFKVRRQDFLCDDPAPSIRDRSLEQRNEFKEFSSLVNTGLYVKNFSVFDIAKNMFVVDAVLWFEFKGSQLDLDVIDHFSILNAKIISKSVPDVKLVKDKLVATYQLVFEMKSNISFKSYPLEDHALSIVLINGFVTPIEMYFNDFEHSHALTLSENLFNSNWAVYSTVVQQGLISGQPVVGERTKSVELPCVVYTINFLRQSFKDFFTLFIPIFAAGFFSWLSLLMNLSNEVGRFNLAIAAVTAIVGYRFVIEQISPQVRYFTILDKFYFFLLGFCFMVFVFHLILTAYWYVLSKRIELEDNAQNLAFAKELHGNMVKKWMNIAFIVGTILMYGLTFYILFY